jgi:hypothetical protein
MKIPSKIGSGYWNFEYNVSGEYFEGTKKSVKPMKNQILSANGAFIFEHFSYYM